MRNLVVKKFGGTSLASLERIKNVANLVLDSYYKKERVVIVASAMSGETQKLEDMVHALSFSPSAASDMVLSSGEQVSVGLLALMIDKISEQKGLACPLLASQIPLLTKSTKFGHADIHTLNNDKIEKLLNAGKIPIIPGFQCFDGQYTKTMGRGGSDTSAVTLAGLLKAERCEIFTDVEGVYSTDPRIYADAKKFHQISTEEMKNLSLNGAKVMHPKAVKAIDDYLVKVEVRSTLKPKQRGTLILSEKICGVAKSKEARIEGITCFENLVAIRRKSQSKKDEFNTLGKTYPVKDGFCITTIAGKDYQRMQKEKSINTEDPLETISNCGQVSLLGRDWNENPQMVKHLKNHFNENDFGLKEMFPINHGMSFLVDSNKAKPLACSLHKRFNKQIRSILDS